ncbi:MAG TPA: class I SAM-dependent methyltransferase [Streptosporangiaceae bacterium]|nr:class I SAM-dependent methyltransferase [Streptosporangiaceae bacterium]
MTDSEVRGHKSANIKSTDANATNYHVSLRAQVISADSAGPLHKIGRPARIGLLRSRQAGSWDRRSCVGLEKVTAAVLAAAAVRPGCQVLDVGCGSGQLSLLLAELGARVLAIDPSQLMIDRLEKRAAKRGPIGLECLATPIERLSLPAESVDLIVTSYALHYLRDVDKGRLVAAAYHWLRPGGMLIVADMMFGRGVTSHDRAIIRSKIGTLARKGVGGWWRIAKNSYRYLVRAQERPVSISTWATMFARAGFKGITASSIINEAGLVTGHRPARPGG